jgi:putative acetyltransferase
VTGEIVIARIDPRETRVRVLIEELDRYMETLYPPDSNYLLDVEALAGSQIRFYAASAGDEVMGCGGIWLHEDCAEIKRVFVKPSARGLGLARKLMARLEDEAKSAGKRLTRLETGIHQPEALGLYRALGYKDCGPFGDYPAGDPLSVFMEKPLLQS